MSISKWVRSVLSVLWKKGIRYWVTAFVFGAVGVWVSHVLADADVWLAPKYSMFMQIQDLRAVHRRVPQTVLVGIGDREYYSDVLAARKPLRRDYVARLVSKLSEAAPRLIALDIDLRSPRPDGPEADFAEYKAEDQALIEAICRAQLSTKIVISRAVYPDASGELLAEPSIYDGNQVCPLPGGQVTTGHLSLPIDLRRIPLSRRLKDGTFADSFALAVARSLAPRQYRKDLDWRELPYARFRSAEEFARLDADSVLAGEGAADIKGQIAIVFGDWHSLAQSRGEQFVDTYRTPIGQVGGAFVHANLIETLLAAEYSDPSPEPLPLVVDIGVASWLAAIFAYPRGLFRKFLELSATALALTAFAWIAFHILAMFFDTIPILAAMYAHAVADQVAEWREDAAKYKKLTGAGE